MDRDKLRERLLGIFVGELEGHVATLRDGLTALERGVPVQSGEDRLTTLRRAAHTIKGAARSAGVPLLQNAGWAMERIFRAAEEGRHALGEGELRLLQESTEAIDEARQCLHERRALEGLRLVSLLATLEENAERCAGAT